MFYRHKTTKTVTETNSSPGEDWDRIAGPENVESPPPGVYDVVPVVTAPAPKKAVSKPRKAAAKKAPAKTASPEPTTTA